MLQTSVPKLKPKLSTKTPGATLPVEKSGESDFPFRIIKKKFRLWPRRFLLGSHQF
jgi:hypothetical protein